MNLIKVFYQKTHYFWIITRILYVLVLVYTVLQLSKADNIQRITIKTLYTSYILLIVYLVITGILKINQPKLVKQIAGIISILFGIYFICLLIFEHEQVYGDLAFGVASWIIMYGGWELSR